MAIILPYKGIMPTIHESVYLAPNATIVGDVTIGEGSSVWFNTILRGDLQPIIVGKYTNIQDNTTVHVMGDRPTIIGDYVTIGHNCIIHCGRIKNNSLVGMGSIVLGYTEISENVIVGAGTLVTQHKKVPRNQMIFGNPSKIVRALREDEKEAVHQSAERYYNLGQAYKGLA